MEYGATRSVQKRGHTALTPFTWFLDGIKRRNGRKGKATLITKEELKAQWEAQRGVCPYTGWTLILPESSRGWIWLSRSKALNPKNPRHASVDRRDSAKGYEVGNVQFVSILANLAKRSMSEEDFISFCQAIAEHWKGKSYVKGDSSPVEVGEASDS